jgi:glutathione S-transferase
MKVRTVMQLYIGNKNYSSWSLRPWLLMRQACIAFDEVKLRLDFDDTSPFKRTLATIAPSGRVPVLVDDGFAVWDTLAIAEYLAEKYPDKALWPEPIRDRARARSLCAEMHSGFAALRSNLPMNIEAVLLEVGADKLREEPQVARDVARIEQMWSEQLAVSGGPFLFGGFGIVDAYYAPVCTRFRTYGLALPPEAAAYAKRVLELPAMQEWEAEARAEGDFLAEDEPYRKAR